MRVRAILFCLLLAVPASSAGNKRVRAASQNASALELVAIQGGCSRVCAQYEACVENRCIEMCRPSCRLGSFCTADQTCRPLPTPKEPILTEAERQELAGQESAESEALVFVDMGGVFAYGVRPGLELGRKDTLVSRLHLFNTGVMSHAVFSGGESQRFEWGFGVSAAYRHYEADYGNMRGFYYGGGLEFSAIRLGSRGAADVAFTTFSAAPFGEFGYRWALGDFAIGFGPTLALRYPVSSTISGQDQEACRVDVACTDTSNRRLEGTIHIELGWFQ